MKGGILFISNGNGEDSIAIKVIKQLQLQSKSPLDIQAWPMVGRGDSYRENGIPIVGAPNLLPSCGFATLSAKWMIRDLHAGWIGTHLRQIRAARSLCGRFATAVAVGDIVVIAASVLSRTPFYFIGCAKSSYYSRNAGYTRLEKKLLRRHCLLSFPRDRLTVGELERAGVPARYLGNPMMDDLEGSGIGFDIPPNAAVLAALPGSRFDAEKNAIRILDAFDLLRSEGTDRKFVCLFALHDGFDFNRMIRMVPDSWSAPDTADGEDQRGICGKLVNRKGTQAWFVKKRFADVLRSATLAVGTAGTANEQAVGLGKPLITFPTEGVMGKRYVRMKMKFFGPSARSVFPESKNVAGAVEVLMADPTQRAKMAAAGRERMGKAGASAAIAAQIIRGLESRKKDNE